MEQIKPRKGFAWRVVAAVFSPFVVISGYLFFSRWPSQWGNTFSDYAALGGSILAGIPFITTLPVRANFRFISLLIYVPLLGMLLFLYTFLFVGVTFGGWL